MRGGDLDYAAVTARVIAAVRHHDDFFQVVPNSVSSAWSFSDNSLSLQAANGAYYLPLQFIV